MVRPGVVWLLCATLGCGSNEDDGLIWQAGERPEAQPIAADLECAGGEEYCGDGGRCVAGRCVGHMMTIDGGPVVMGSLGTEGDGHERPAYLVTVPSFRMDRYEVTNFEFAEFLRAKGNACSEFRQQPVPCLFDCNLSGIDCDADFAVRKNCQGPNGAESCDAHPVTTVTWDAAVAYCKWRGRRLPSDSEWTLAANGAAPELTFRRFPWGAGWLVTEDLTLGDQGWTDHSCPVGFNTPPDSLGVDELTLTACVAEAGDVRPANCREDNCEDGYPATSPVGAFASGVSPSGIHDLSGNVWEWVQDCWHDTGENGHVSTDGAPVDGSAWETDCSYQDRHGGWQHPVRGGSYGSPGRSARTRSRKSGAEGATDIGFRCAADP